MGLPELDVVMIRTAGRQRPVQVNGRDPYQPAEPMPTQRSVEVAGRRRTFTWTGRRPPHPHQEQR